MKHIDRRTRVVAGAGGIAYASYLLFAGEPIQILGSVPILAALLWLSAGTALRSRSVRQVAGGLLFALSVGAIGAAVYLKVR